MGCASRGNAHLGSLSIGCAQRSAFPFLPILSFCHCLFAHRPDIEVCIFTPADTTVIAKHAGWQVLGTLPPDIGFSSPASTADGVSLPNVSDY